MLKPGSKAPDIDLLDQNGKPFSLAKQGKGKILVYFYPTADTPGCTAQSCGLRDIAADIGRTKIVGISPDKPEKQKKFDDKYSLGFPLLADTENTVAKAYKVRKKKSMYGREYMWFERSAF
ncbi:MAG: peroxiredoxin, partial [Actinomycetota bacterium]